MCLPGEDRRRSDAPARTRSSAAPKRVLVPPPRARRASASGALEPYRQADGAFRVSTSATDGPECGLPPGLYTMAIRDATSNALLASGDVELAP